MDKPREGVDNHIISIIRSYIGEILILIPLKDRLNPPKPVSVFIRDKTTDAFKNQILGIVSKYYHSDSYGRFCISSYSFTIIETYSISVSLEPRTPEETYTDSSVFSCLKECSDYKFFEFLDCIIYVLYSNFNIRYDPIFIEFISDINDSLKLHGIDYVIVEGHLQYRTEEVVMNSAVIPCMSILNRHGLFDADRYLSDAYQSYKQGNNDEAITLAVKSLENVVQFILNFKGINYDPKKSKLQDRIPLLLKDSNSEFLSKKITDQYVQMEKIFQVAMTSRNEVAHGSNSFQADDALVEHTLNIVSSDILFLVKICLE